MLTLKNLNPQDSKLEIQLVKKIVDGRSQMKNKFFSSFFGFFTTILGHLEGMSSMPPSAQAVFRSYAFLGLRQTGLKIMPLYLYCYKM